MRTRTIWATLQTVRKLRQEQADLYAQVCHIGYEIEHGDFGRGSHGQLSAEKKVLLSRLRRVEQALGRSRVLPSSWGHKSKVHVNDTVYLRHKDTIRALTLVDPSRADPYSGLISAGSPQGHELLGRRPGETIPIDTLDGCQKFELIKIC